MKGQARRTQFLLGEILLFLLFQGGLALLTEFGQLRATSYRGISHKRRSIAAANALKIYVDVHADFACAGQVGRLVLLLGLPVVSLSSLPFLFVFSIFKTLGILSGLFA